MQTKDVSIKGKLTRKANEYVQGLIEEVRAARSALMKDEFNTDLQELIDHCNEEIRATINNPRNYEQNY